MEPYVRCITSLLNSSHEGIKELAASALANLACSANGGREMMERHAAVKSLQARSRVKASAKNKENRY